MPSRAIRRPAIISASPLFGCIVIQQPKSGFEKFFGDIQTMRAPAWDWAWRCTTRIAIRRPPPN